MRLLISSVSIVILLIATAYLLQTKAYMLVSFIVLGLVIAPFFMRFEKRKVNSKEIVLLAMLAALAAVSRVPFASIPSVQPTSFIVIMAGIVFGSEAGFLVGAISALVSNIFLGQGPWTPWQMFAWGMMGMTAGLLKDVALMKLRIGLSIFGFVWGYLFGWFMNIWFMMANVENWSIQYFIATYTSSFYFDLAHGVTNVVLILLFSVSWIKVLQRFKKKYALVKTI